MGGSVLLREHRDANIFEERVTVPPIMCRLASPDTSECLVEIEKRCGFAHFSFLDMELVIPVSCLARK